VSYTRTLSRSTRTTRSWRSTGQGGCRRHRGRRERRPAGAGPRRLAAKERQLLARDRPPFLPTGDVSYGGYFAGLDFDQFDTLYFPTRGWSTNLRYFSTNDPDSDYSRLDTEFKGAYPFGRYVLSGEAYYGGSPRGTLRSTTRSSSAASCACRPSRRAS